MSITSYLSDPELTPEQKFNGLTKMGVSPSLALTTLLRSRRGTLEIPGRGVGNGNTLSIPPHINADPRFATNLPTRPSLMGPVMGDVARDNATTAAIRAGDTQGLQRPLFDPVSAASWIAAAPVSVPVALGQEALGTMYGGVLQDQLRGPTAPLPAEWYRQASPTTRLGNPTAPLNVPKTDLLSANYFGATPTTLLEPEPTGLAKIAQGKLPPEGKYQVAFGTPEGVHIGAPEDHHSDLFERLPTATQNALGEDNSIVQGWIGADGKFFTLTANGDASPNARSLYDPRFNVSTTRPTTSLNPSGGRTDILGEKTGMLMPNQVGAAKTQPFDPFTDGPYFREAFGIPEEPPEPPKRVTAELPKFSDPIPLEGPPPNDLLYHGLGSEWGEGKEGGQLERLSKIQQEGMKGGWFATEPYEGYGPTYLAISQQHLPPTLQIHSYEGDVRIPNWRGGELTGEFSKEGGFADMPLLKRMGAVPHLVQDNPISVHPYHIYLADKVKNILGRLAKSRGGQKATTLLEDLAELLKEAPPVE
jgi:hypothetical protein